MDFPGLLLKFHPSRDFHIINVLHQICLKGILVVKRPYFIALFGDFACIRVFLLISAESIVKILVLKILIVKIPFQ